MNEHEYYCFLKEFWKVTNDGFIIVDPNGVIVDINETYCECLGKTREPVLGKPIGEVISTTSMYDVLSSARDGDDNVYLQPYGENDNASNVETHAVANRFCFFNEQGELLGAAAQMSFKERAAAMAYSIATEELNYYKRAYEESSEEDSGFSKILGNSEAMQKLKETAMRVARKDFPVLITGETGTGKELFAQAIHRESSRRKKPIISINCASIPSELLESELFGYDEGAFTGAKKGGKIGKFQLADGGTIFLDEIGDLPMAMQAKLLRVLQEGEIEKVGGQKSVPIDVRVIAATNQPLEQMIEDGTFRMDLYFRLNVISIEIPPLRKRGSDVILLANEFLDTFNHKYQKEKHMKESVYQALMNYKWPGNVRELRNVVESAVVLTMSDSIGAGDLPEYISGVAAEENVQQDAQTKELSMLEDGMHFDSLKEQVEAYEKHVIAAALERCQGDRNAVIQELKVSRRTFYRKLAEYGLS